MSLFPPFPSSILFFALSFSFFFSFILPSLHHHHLLLRFFLGFSGVLCLVTAIALVMIKKPPHSVIKDAPRGIVADGSASCTERLAFECFDESWLMDQLENRPAEDSSCLTGTAAEICRRTSHRVRKEARSFPPPLSSLNLNGQPSFFLRSERKDGTLTLTEVRIHRPEILRAWRHDGRLTLHLIPEDDFEEDDGEEEEEEQEEEQEEIAKAIRDEDEEFRLGDWKFGNEGLRRCHQGKHPLKLQMPGVGIA